MIVVVVDIVPYQPVARNQVMVPKEEVEVLTPVDVELHAAEQTSIEEVDSLV